MRIFLHAIQQERPMFRRIAVAFLVTIVAFVNGLRAEEPAAKPDAAATGKSTVVPVFRLDGELTERPADEELPIFQPPGTSLKDLIERMNKAAKDPAVKAVVVV